MSDHEDAIRAAKIRTGLAVGEIEIVVDAYLEHMRRAAMKEPRPIDCVLRRATKAEGLAALAKR